MRLGLAAWKPHALPYHALECVLLWLKDINQLCEPPPGDTQVRGQLLVMTPQEIELPARMAVFLRTDDYVLELPQVCLRKTYALCHLKTDRADFRVIPWWVEFYAFHGFRPRWHPWRESLRELVVSRLEAKDMAGEKLERMSLARLRKILGEEFIGTDGAAGFDSEGTIRRN
jgi:hypothetical protein